MPVIQLPDADLSYFLIPFDAEGNERAEGAERVSPRVLQSLTSEPITDVFLMSHGWKGDVPEAIAQYNRWSAAMLQCPDDLRRMKERRPGFKPMILGLHWPSLPWGDEELGGLSFAAPMSGSASGPTLIDLYAERISNTPAARQALTTIFAAIDQEVAPAKLPTNVRDALVVLNREANLGSGGDAPAADREPFDPDERYAEAQEDDVTFGIGDFFGGILDLVRQLSFWKMKDRARLIGETAGHSLLKEMLAARPATRFHLMGHSFGCIVMSATLAGPQGSQLPRPVDSLFLIQGAMSLWSYCGRIPVATSQTGYFHSVLTDQRVRGPILTTQSEHDTAVGKYYPLGAGAAREVSFAQGQLPRYGAVGAFGLCGLEGVEALSMRALAEDYAFRPSTIYNLESSNIIRKMEGASGAHSDIAHAEVAHAVWQAALVTA
jgi:hypothetical protein